ELHQVAQVDTGTSHFLARPFDGAHAWIDLLLRAAWRDHDDGFGRPQRRGACHTSQVALAQCWGWPRKRVQRFLNQLQRAGMVEITTDKSRSTGGTIIFIVNYEKYQGDAGSTLERPCPAADPATN